MMITANHPRRRAMRSVLICGSIAAVVLVADVGSGVQAGWCAMYKNGGTNCGFATHAQCLSAVSGVGGLCNIDPSTAAEPERARRERPERRKQEAAPRHPEPARAAAP